jgi:hypothetical protein
MSDVTRAARVVRPIERERTVVTGLLVLQVLLWLGFAVHRSPRFPGSLSGTALGVAGAALMVLPSFAYLASKRVPALKRWVTPRVPLPKLVAWHVYGGILGSVLAILHTGHRFQSTLGIALTGIMLVSVFSGYGGRHFLRQVSLDLREKQALLAELVTAYNETARHLSAGANTPASETMTLGYRATELAGSIADLEYTIKAHELLKRRYSTWIALHIGSSVAFYILLGLHIWASVYFGLRWLA